jgi:hypothetical protein
MRSIALLSGFVALCLSLASVPAAALTPDQLKTSTEQQRYAALKGDKTEQANYLITRDYVYKAHDVVTGKLKPDKMPDEPDEYESKYLLPGDALTLRTAIKLALTAYIDSQRTA